MQCTRSLQLSTDPRCCSAVQQQQQQLLPLLSKPLRMPTQLRAAAAGRVQAMPSVCLHHLRQQQQQQQQQHLSITQHHPQQQVQRHQHQRCANSRAAAFSGRRHNQQLVAKNSSRSWGSISPQHIHQHRHPHVAASAAAAASMPADGFDSSDQQQQQPHGAKAIPPRVQAAADEETYSLRDTQILVETAMLSAVSGLAFLLSTLLKLDNSLGYFLPLPITIAACRSGVAAGWHTMMATAFLLLVLLGPLRAITYVLMHGMLAASLGSMWVWKWPWALSIPAGAVLRMAGQLGYLLLSSLTMNENLFQVMLANVHNLLDQLSAALGSCGSPSTLAITSMIFALLLVNGICYVFLLHVVYHVILGSMGFKLGALPGFVRKYLYAGVPQQQQAGAAGGGQPQQQQK